MAKLAGASMTVRIGTNAIHGPIHEFGGTIVAKSGYLVFEIDGEWISVPSVDIPARPFMRPAFDEGHAAALLIIRNTFRKMVLSA